jgi:hypothetical protein
LIDAALEPRRAEVRRGIVEYLSERIRRLQAKERIKRNSRQKSSAIS